MMRKCLSILAGIFATGISLQAQPQAHSWAKCFNPNSATAFDQYVYAVAYDGSETYVAGVFNGSMTLNGNTQSGGFGGSGYIAHFDNTGTCQGFTSLGAQSNVKALTIVGSNVYLTGNMGGYFYMGRVATGFANNATVDYEVLDEGEGRGLANDGSNVYVTGEMDHGMVFNPSGTPITLTGHSTYHSLFVAKFPVSGFSSTAVAYSAAVEPYSSAAVMEGNAIAYYSNNIYVTGFFGGATQLTSSSTSISPAGGATDIFVVSLSNALSWTNMHAGGSTAGVPGPYTGDAEYKDAGYAIAANTNGVFVAGATTGNSTFDAQTSTTATYLNSVLVRYPVTAGIIGNASWVNVGKATGVLGIGGDPGKIISTGIALSATGNIYVSGIFDDFAGTFYGQGGTSRTLNSTGNDYGGSVACYAQTTGNIKWVSTVQATSGSSSRFYNRVYAVCTASTCDQFWYGGGLRSTSKVGNISMPVTYPGYTVGFAASANGILTLSSDVTTCSGQTVTLTANYGRGGSYSWSPATNLSCPTCSSTNFSQTTAGTYSYVVTGTLIGSTCPTSAAVSVTVLPAVTANAGHDVRLCTSPQRLGAAAQTGATYSWSPSTGLSCTTCAQPYASATGNYTVTVTDYCGNVTTDVVTVYPYDGVLCNGYTNPNEPLDPHRVAAAQDESPSIDVFPNPTDGTLNVNFGTENSRTITLTDVTGREVLRMQTDQLQVQLDLSGIGKGMFLLNVNENGKETVRKIVVQ